MSTTCTYHMVVLSKNTLERFAKCTITMGDAFTLGSTTDNMIRLKPEFLPEVQPRHAAVHITEDGSSWFVENLVNKFGAVEIMGSSGVIIPLAPLTRSRLMTFGERFIVCGRHFIVEREGVTKKKVSRGQKRAQHAVSAATSSAKCSRMEQAVN